MVGDAGGDASDGVEPLGLDRGPRSGSRAICCSSTARSSYFPVANVTSRRTIAWPSDSSSGCAFTIVPSSSRYAGLPSWRKGMRKVPVNVPEAFSLAMMRFP